MMAEFAEVMKQWRRFCKSRDNCGECAFDGRGICGEAHLTDIPYADIEQTIMSWAAEHPEPVYPSWGEWLIEQGIAEIGSGMLAIDPSKAVEHIPADIAQKLGLEPKEG